jgi:ribosomal protein L16 Arg81 hydroxylase
MIHRLKDLVAPLSEPEFLESFAQKRRVLVKTTQSDRFASLLSWATINHLIDAGVIQSSSYRLVLKGQRVPESMYRRGEEEQLHPDMLQQLAAQGVSIVIDGIDKYVQSIATLADAIERRIGHTVWVNCYITFGTASAFNPHYDTHDVLAVQIQGTKRWRGYGIPVVHPVIPFSRHRDTEITFGDSAWEEFVEPGDVLYVPRGEGHDAVCEVKPSVHLTIGILAPNGIKMLNWMARRAENNPVFRMDVTRVGGQEALNNHGRLLKRHLHELIDQLSFDEFLDESDQQRSPRSRLNLGLNGVLRSDTWLAPTPRRRIALLADMGGEVKLTVGGNAIRLSADARRTLELLLENDGLSFLALAKNLMTTAEDSRLRQSVVELAAKGLVAVES